MHFHLPFKIPGTSFHPLLPIGICSPLIICHLEKLCLNSLCIWPLPSVYLGYLNRVLGLRTASHASTKSFPSQEKKIFQYPTCPESIYETNPTLQVLIEINMCFYLHSIPLWYTHIYILPSLTICKWEFWSVWSNQYKYNNNININHNALNQIKHGSYHHLKCVQNQAF